VWERFEGHARVRSCMSEFANGFVLPQRDIPDTIVEGERAVSRSRVQVRLIPKDKTITTEILDMSAFKTTRSLSWWSLPIRACQGYSGGLARPALDCDSFGTSVG
jgi:hypothetical protein